MLDQMKCLAYPGKRVDRPGNTCNCLSCSGHRKKDLKSLAGSTQIEEMRSHLEDRIPKTFSYLESHFGNPSPNEKLLVCEMVGNIVGELMILNRSDEFILDIVRRIAQDVEGQQ